MWLCGIPWLQTEKIPLFWTSALFKIKYFINFLPVRKTKPFRWHKWFQSDQVRPNQCLCLLHCSWVTRGGGCGGTWDHDGTQNRKITCSFSRWQPNSLGRGQSLTGFSGDCVWTKATPSGRGLRRSFLLLWYTIGPQEWMSGAGSEASNHYLYLKNSQSSYLSLLQMWEKIKFWIVMAMLSKLYIILLFILCYT